MTIPADSVLVLEQWADNARTLLMAANLCGTGGGVTRNRAEPSQDDDLPIADVFIGADDGNGIAPNQGVPHFENRTKLGIEIRHKADGGPNARTKCSQDAALVLNALLPRLDQWAPEAEGIEKYRVEYLVATEGQYTESRAQITIEIAHRTFWPADASGLSYLDTVLVTGPAGTGADIPVPQTP